MATAIVRRRALAVLKVLAKAAGNNQDLTTAPSPSLTRKKIAQCLREEHGEQYAHYQSVIRDQEPELISAGLCVRVGKASHNRLHITYAGLELAETLDELPDFIRVSVKQAPRLRTASARRKGHSYERELAKQLRVIGFTDAARHLEYQNNEAAAGRDLTGTQPFAIQAKHWKTSPPISAIEQVVPTDEYPIPVAFLKRTQVRGKPGLEVMVVHADVGLRMLKLLHDHGLLNDLYL